MYTKAPLPIEHVAEHIADYLAANPHAADTVDGIRSWWLAGATPSVSRREVENAIRILLQRGTLKKHMLPDGTTIYARVPDIPVRARN